MTTVRVTQPNSVRVGQYYRCGWGYDQTQYDFLIVTAVSASGKQATCRMVHPVHVGEDAGTDHLVPGEPFGETFHMAVRSAGYYGPTLRGSYQFAGSSKRLDTFFFTESGHVAYQTSWNAGH